MSSSKNRCKSAPQTSTPSMPPSIPPTASTPSTSSSAPPAFPPPPSETAPPPAAPPASLPPPPALPATPPPPPSATAASPSYGTSSAGSRRTAAAPVSKAPKPQAQPQAQPRPLADGTPPPPELTGPHGTDADDYREWAAKHAPDDLFATLYLPRRAKILANLERRPVSDLFLQRLEQATHPGLVVASPPAPHDPAALESFLKERAEAFIDRKDDPDTKLEAIELLTAWLTELVSAPELRPLLPH